MASHGLTPRVRGIRRCLSSRVEGPVESCSRIIFPGHGLACFFVPSLYVNEDYSHAEVSCLIFTAGCDSELALAVKPTVFVWCKGATAAVGSDERLNTHLSVLEDEVHTTQPLERVRDPARPCSRQTRSLRSINGGPGVSSFISPSYSGRRPLPRGLRWGGQAPSTPPSGWQCAPRGLQSPPPGPRTSCRHQAGPGQRAGPFGSSGARRWRLSRHAGCRAARPRIAARGSVLQRAAALTSRGGA